MSPSVDRLRIDNGRDLFSSRTGGDSPKLYRWRLTAGTNLATAPALTRLPLQQPEGVTSLTLSSNSVVLTGTKGSEVLALDEIEGGADHWIKTSPGISGVSRDGRWLAIFHSFSSSLYIYKMAGLGSVAKLVALGNIASFDSPHREMKWRLLRRMEWNSGVYRIGNEHARPRISRQ